MQSASDEEAVQVKEGVIPPYLVSKKRHVEPGMLIWEA